MIITGLFTYNNFLYFANTDKKYILYRSATEGRFLKKDELIPITDLDAISDSIITHNEEVKKQAANNWNSYERTKNPIFKRGAELFEASVIINREFPYSNKLFYD